MAEQLFDVQQPSGDKKTDGATIVLRVHCQPGAGRSQVVGRRGDALHVRVAPPPADGRANAACIELLAEILDIAKTSIEIASGEKSRDKRFKITGVDPEHVTQLLNEAVERGSAKGAGARRGAR